MKIVKIADVGSRAKPLNKKKERGRKRRGSKEDRRIGTVHVANLEVPPDRRCFWPDHSPCNSGKVQRCTEGAAHRNPEGNREVGGA